MNGQISALKMLKVQQTKHTWEREKSLRSEVQPKCYGNTEENFLFGLWEGEGKMRRTDGRFWGVGNIPDTHKKSPEARAVMRVWCPVAGSKDR